MGKFRKAIVGSLVGAALTLGSADVALATPATTATTAPSTSSPSTTAPSTTGPITTGPSSTGPSSTGPSTTGPSTTGPSTIGPSTTGPTTPSPSSTPKKPAALTGRQIWWIVRPGHGVDCPHAAKQVQRVRTAVAAAEKRLGRWQAKQSTLRQNQTKSTARRSKASSGKVKGFQKLDQEGQALIRRIDAKCSLTSPAG
jgi:hypothetical protein